MCNTQCLEPFAKLCISPYDSSLIFLQHKFTHFTLFVRQFEQQSSAVKNFTNIPCLCQKLLQISNVILKIYVFLTVHLVTISVNSQLDALFIYLFIHVISLFRASHRSSSGDWNAFVHHLVWLVCVSDCLVCRPAYQAVTYTD